MGQGNPGLVQNMNSDNYERLMKLKLNSFSYLFIYKLRQEAWITHRASSTTRTRAKKRKLATQLTRITIL